MKSYRKRRLPLASLSTVLLFSQLCAAAPKEVCIFPTADGSVRQVNSLADVPPEVRAHAKCFSSRQDNYLAKPEDIQLDGSIRREDITSSIGRIQLRWPRKVEGAFGRTPLRATTDAAMTVSKALQHPAIPADLKTLSLPWQIVFLDADLPETQIPQYLIDNCHPGWMTPPANIYIVAQRVAGQCGGHTIAPRVADEQLSRVLIHEMGHAIEYQLLKGAGGQDRQRAEGFATWFEQYAANYSGILSQRKVAEELKTRVIQSIMRGEDSPVFQGTAEDYARSAMFFNAIVAKRGLSSLMDVYSTMAKEKVSFSVAIAKRLDWNAKRLSDEVVKYLGLKK